jgi:hypothetical protein
VGWFVCSNFSYAVRHRLLLEPVFVRSQNLDSGSGAVFCVICAQPSWDTQIGPVELTFLTA